MYGSIILFLLPTPSSNQNEKKRKKKNTGKWTAVSNEDLINQRGVSIPCTYAYLNAAALPQAVAFLRCSLAVRSSSPNLLTPTVTFWRSM